MDGDSFTQEPDFHEMEPSAPPERLLNSSRARNNNNRNQTSPVPNVSFQNDNDNNTRRNHNNNQNRNRQRNNQQRPNNDEIISRQLEELMHGMSSLRTLFQDSVDRIENLERTISSKKEDLTFTQAKGRIPSPGNYSSSGSDNPDPTFDRLYFEELAEKERIELNNINNPLRSTQKFNSLRQPRGQPQVASKSNNPIVSNNNRRNSILENLIKSENDTYKNINAPTMQYTRMIPSFDHIKLSDLTLKSVMKFMNEIMEYEFRYGVTINMKAHISDQCFRKLSVKFHNRIDYQDRYKNINRAELGKLLLDYVKPDTQSTFREILEGITLKYDSQTITEDEYKRFYEALIEYSLQFLKWFEVLSDRADPKIIPACNNKDKGLIKIFLSKLPGELGQELYAELCKEYPQVINDKSLTFQEFHTLFIELIETHNARHKSTRSALNMYANVGKSSAKHKEHKQTTSYSNNNDRYSNERNKFQNKNKNLHNISEVRLEDNSDTSDVEPNSTPNLDITESLQHDVLNEQDNSPDFQLGIDQEEILEEFPSDLNAVSSAQTQPQVCFSMIFYNRCEKPNCKYLHDGPSMYRAHAHYVSLLQKSKFSNGTSGSTNNRSNNVSRDYGKDNRQSKPQGLHVILPYQVDSTQDDSLQQDGYLHMMKKSVTDSHPYMDLVKTVIRPGVVHLSNGVMKTLDNILFDTGALHGNYLSSDWFRNNRHLIAEDDIFHVDTRVRLADNKTVVGIEYVVRMAFTFSDARGNVFELLDNFSVINTSTSAIIGLPAILLQLGNYFHDFIGQAILNFSSNSPTILRRESSISNVELDLEHSLELQPWSKVSSTDEAPEDFDTPLPCAFTEALHFMEVGYEQAKQEFIDLIPSHVSPEFASQTDIVNLLTTKGLDVFIPQNWKGVQGVPPLQLEWRPDVPTYMKPKPWPINPRLYGNAHKECQRLQKYFYRKSNSPVASNLVIAPKATPPFIRFCGNYVAIGKYIVTGHYPIPRVLQALEKIVKFQVFLDFDLANAFHQFLIDDKSSSLLSVQTPWGQFEPMFLPEGIPPASGELQKYMDIIFEPIKDYAIVIFDNLLVLATDFQDAYNKVNTVFDLCLKHNLFLKFSKTWLGFPEVKFFGYICRHKSYSLSQERKDSLQGIPFPTSKKAMQSFLGAALFFKNFIANYSTITAPLNDMLKKDFSWDPNTWKQDYKSIFDQVKAALQSSSSIFYPNYDFKWILRTDASDFGVGAVLLQVDDTISPPQHQPIGFVSQKLSPQATRWSTIEKEAYAVYFGVKSFSYYLIGKPFVLQTDHANLQWMEASVVPKILRWRIYLQTYQFVIQHIPGKVNTVADWLSRLSIIYLDEEVVNSCLQDPNLYANKLGSTSYSLNCDTFCYIHMLQSILDSDTIVGEDLPTTPTLIPSPYKDPKEVLHQVHNSRMGHHGVRKTYLLLNTHFPGHRIPHKVVADFVSTCPICQKERLGMVDNIQPLTKHLKTEHIHSAIGADVLTVTPEDEAGNKYLIVVVNHFTKLVFLFAAKVHDAVTMATALFSYISIYGLVDILYSDPGSDLMSETVEHLNKWLGIRHKVSLVDRHQSNGVEGTNKQILKHLRSLVYDERVLRNWSSPTVLPIIQYIINSTVNSETNMVPFDLHFGQQAMTYHKVPSNLNFSSQVNTFIQNLNSNLQHLLEVSRKHQSNLVSKRTGSESNNIQFINQYQPGDYVLKQLDMSKPRPSKLHPQFLGPFEVISHVGNDIQARNIITGEVKTFHTDMVKIFHGDREQAFKTAMVDTDQYEVDCIISYRGDPETRTTTEFLVRYKDGEELWVPYSKDIATTEQFETFCRSNSQLFYLLYSSEVAKQVASRIKSAEISLVQPGNTVYVNLRSYGEAWYKTLDLPDKFSKTYVVEYRYSKWASTRNHKKIVAICKVFNEIWTVDNLFIHTFGHTTAYDHEKMILVTSELLSRYPFLVSGSKSEK